MKKFLGHCPKTLEEFIFQHPSRLNELSDSPIGFNLI